MLIKERPIVCAIGVTDDCVFRYNRGNFTYGHRTDQSVTNRMPFTIWLEWWNSQDVSHVRQSFVTLNHLSDVIEFRLVEILAHRALTRCRCCTRDTVRVTLKFGSEVFCALRLNAVFQSLIQRESVPQIQDSALVGGTLDCFELVRLRCLFVDLLQKRGELSKTKIFPVALLPAEQAEDVCVLHDKHRVLIGNGSIEQRVD